MQRYLQLLCFSKQIGIKIGYNYNFETFLKNILVINEKNNGATIFHY